MGYLYDACDQISDFCHQQLLRKISWTDGRTDRGKTVYPPPPSGSGGIAMLLSDIYQIKPCQYIKGHLMIIYSASSNKPMVSKN